MPGSCRSSRHEKCPSVPSIVSRSGSPTVESSHQDTEAGRRDTPPDQAAYPAANTHTRKACRSQRREPAGCIMLFCSRPVLAPQESRDEIPRHRPEWIIEIPAVPKISDTNAIPKWALANRNQLQSSSIRFHLQLRARPAPRWLLWWVVRVHGGVSTRRSRLFLGRARGAASRSAAASWPIYRPELEFPRAVLWGSAREPE
ncbi:Uncharacterised protein [Mycobacteroides abscessus subsp. abscessus]|nr:Uncharacterised protein [Mycobacteroides abscessus subsp. abscessus]SHX20863.1 Uncharacterised protein [Mycobacteroides abscessus subsp. abscessus]SIH54406.1 Uncharacterised protein [Mycobacteroides abscessus subsp. abscessus]SKD20040.1 Uncharacterised protein [Mycobacteroides abscessus subsp. abscessus]SKM92025.1 Uncharacterised protein [Mycobacteroides abscessus subsp. abscessus]